MGIVINYRAVLAELIATMFLIFFAVGNIMVNGTGSVLQIAFGFGFSIMVLAWALEHYSGAQINPAITFGMVCMKKMQPVQAVANIVGQLIGSFVGCLLLSVIVKKDADVSNGFGRNAISEKYSTTTAFVAELICTCALMFVVLETGINARTEGNKKLAPIARGLVVFLCHCLMVAVDGCSINPARSFGPELMAEMDNRGTDTLKAFKDQWVFWAGPLAGSAVACVLYTVMAEKLDKFDDMDALNPAEEE